MARAAPSPISYLLMIGADGAGQTAPSFLAVFSRPIGGIAGVALLGYLAQSQAGIGRYGEELRGQGQGSATDPSRGQDGVEPGAKQAHINQHSAASAESRSWPQAALRQYLHFPNALSLGQECKARRY
jgi:hypothetical protein